MIAYLTPYVERYDVNRDVDFMENESTARSGCFGSVRKAKLIPLNKVRI